MTDPDFCAVVSARLDPVLAPRGFPYAACDGGGSAPGETSIQGYDGALFHCDGVEAVTEAMARYPGWSKRLRESYGPEAILCLDLWVQQRSGMRSWSFEGFEDDVVRIAGAEAEQRFASLSSGPLDKWVDQLGFMLDRYFTAMETRGRASEV